MESKVFGRHARIRKALSLLFLCFLCVGIAPQVIMAESETDSVETIQELNQALGGNHKVQGDTITLRSDVVVRDSISVANYKSNKIVIDMNGHTITGKNEPERAMFYVDKPQGHANLKIYLEGKGKIQAKGTIFSVENYSMWRAADDKIRNHGVIMYFDGDITYQVTEDGHVIGGAWRVTVNNGRFVGKKPITTTCGTLWNEDVRKTQSYIVINGGIIEGDCFFEKTKWKMTGGTIIGDVKTDSPKNYLKNCTIDGSLLVGHDWGGYENSLQVKENAYISKGLKVNSVYARIHVMGGTITGEDVAIDVIDFGNSDYWSIDDLYEKGSYIKISDGVIRATGEDGIGIRTLGFAGYEDPSQGKTITRVILKGGEIIAKTPVTHLIK